MLKRIKKELVGHIKKNMVQKHAAGGPGEAGRPV
jgi:hypothetical protein